MSTERDKARYPFTAEAAEFIRKLGLRIEDLTSEYYRPILVRAEQRIRQALTEFKVTPQEHDINIEVTSFPTAVMLMSYVKNELAKRRYALAESKSFSERLREEPTEKILRIAKETFGWDVKPTPEGEGQTGDFQLHFKQYLTNMRNLRELRWKLTNRPLRDGYVQLMKEEATRLIEEEIQRRILEKTKNPPAKPPEALQDTIESIERLASTSTPSQTPIQNFDLKIKDSPPCIKKLIETLSSGGRLSHIGRFTLTSFLVNAGAKEEEIIGFFKSASDFDERKTKYQVEHISGRRGGKTKYIPPKCDTLKTHGVCSDPDELCKRIRHPLTYYKIKAGRFKRRQVQPTMKT
jgi:DNA primase large subunit